MPGRPAVKGPILAGAALLLLGGVAWLGALEPSNEREWAPDHAVLSHARLDQSRLMQNRHVLRHGRRRQPQHLDDLAQAQLPRAQEPNRPHSVFIGKGLGYRQKLPHAVGFSIRYFAI